jgi:hypothetical protein
MVTWGNPFGASEDIVAGIAKNTAVSEIDAKVFDTLPDHSKVTRGPF